MRWGKALRAGACLSLLAILAGCEQFEISDRTMKINDAVQNADTRQVLVNIVRASKQYPLIFTATSQIVSSGIADGSSVGFTIPFGPKNGNVYSASPSFKLQEGLSVTTAPLDTQEFEEGFMQPLAVSTLGYYLDNGWTPQILLHAFVQQIDVPTRLVNAIKFAVRREPICPVNDASDTKCILVPDVALFNQENNPACPDLAALTAPAHQPTAGDADTNMTRLINAPNDKKPCAFAAFQYFVALLEAVNVRVASAPQTTTTDGNAASVSTSPDTKTINVNVAVDASGGDKADKDTSSFAIDNVLGGICSAPAAAAPAPAAPGGAKNGAKPPARQPIAPLALPSPELRFAPSHAPASTSTAPPAAPALCADPANTRFVIRAPEGVIYYLGTLLNLATRGFKVTVRNATYRDNLTLFDPVEAKDGSPPLDAIVSATVDDDIYYVPKAAPGSLDETMHMITLVQQIVALQKKGSSLPTVPSVQLIGQ